MRFFIEVVRAGSNGLVLVTLRDGPTPKINELLRDEEGDLWRTTALLPNEVEVKPCGRPKEFPKGRVLESAPAAHAAA